MTSEPVPAPADAATAVPPFEAFVSADGAKLRAALVARYGTDIGLECAAEALAYAWQHWDRVGPMANRVGYLYRVGQSAARRHVRWRRRPALPLVPPTMQDEVHPELPAALARLSTNQRVAVVLVHAYGWAQLEAAEVMGISPSSLRTHLARGTKRLGALLKEQG